MKGGGRRRAGRPKGRKDKRPRVRSKARPLPKHEASSSLKEFFKDGLYHKAIPFLTKEQRDHYNKMLGSPQTDEIKVIDSFLIDLQARYSDFRVIELKTGKRIRGMEKLVDTIKQLVELKDRIKNARPDSSINIFNILTEKKYEKEAKKITERVFDLPKTD